MKRVVSSGSLCRIFAHRTTHTACVACCFLEWLMSDLRFYNEAFTAYAGKKRIRRDTMESVALVGIDGLVWREL